MPKRDASFPWVLVAARCAALLLPLAGCASTPAAIVLPELPGTEGDPETTITAEEILGHIEVLASDLFEGREAGTRGEQRAAAYIIDQLEESPRLQPAGVDGGWLQPFPLVLHKQDATAHNICALLPGSDPVLSRETIVLGAHYDHVGFGESGNALDKPGPIHNGADDNASGSSTLLDLATSLANSGWQPRRSILFQWYSGEELGLLGSKYWCEHPLMPIEDTIFMLNMDMVGRLVQSTLVVGGTGTSPGLGPLARAACERNGLVMIDDPPGSAPSDNSSFYDRMVPVLFLFSGLHDDYHSAGDDAAKINADGAARIGRTAETVLLALDARDERPAFLVSPGEALLFRPDAYIGATFGVVSDRAAPGPVQVTVVIPGSPAEAAGLREGDVIIAVDGVSIAVAPAVPAVPAAPGAVAAPGETTGPAGSSRDVDDAARNAALIALEQRCKRIDDGLPAIVLRIVRDGSAPRDVSLKPVIR